MSHRALGPQFDEPMLPGMEFLSRGEVARLVSGDFGGRVGSKRTRQAWLRGAKLEPQGRHRDHGGPQGYLDHLSEDIRRRGIQEPVGIDWDHLNRPRLYEGHHRSFAALDAGIERIPFEAEPRKRPR